jgi:hypothetical protein
MRGELGAGFFNSLSKSNFPIFEAELDLIAVEGATVFIFEINNNYLP